MRRSRFANTVESKDVRERASIGDALLFDVTTPPSTDEEALGEWRLSALQHAPLMLGLTHALITICYVLLSPALQTCACTDNPLIPSLAAIGVDSATAGLMFARKRIGMAPQRVFRLLCVYLAVTGLL